MSVTVKNPVIKQRIQKLRKPPIKQALNAVKSDLVNDTVQRGWTRFKSGIQTVQDTDTSGRIFVDKSGTPSNNQIGAWQQWGTPDHGPVTAKALRFKIGSKVIFAKWVKGIKSTNWWGLKYTAVKKVREIYNKWIKSFGK